MLCSEWPNNGGTCPVHIRLSGVRSYIVLLGKPADYLLYYAFSRHTGSCTTVTVVLVLLRVHLKILNTRSIVVKGGSTSPVYGYHPQLMTLKLSAAQA
jgi:hypothetical protein